MIKLINGDCLEEMDKLIAQGVKVDCILADPPYNLVGKIGEDRIHMFRQSRNSKETCMTKEKMSFDKKFDQISWLKRIPKILNKSGNVIIFNDWENMGDISRELKKNKIKVKCLNHWQKNNPVPAEWQRRFVPGREYFLHASRGKYVFNVEELNKGIFNYPLTKKSEKIFGKHPNQKPLVLIRDLILILTNKGDIILDPFSGSGTTPVACINTGRNCIAIEKDEKYYNIEIERCKQAEKDKKYNLFQEGDLK